MTDSEIEEILMENERLSDENLALILENMRLAGIVSYMLDEGGVIN